DRELERIRVDAGRRFALRELPHFHLANDAALDTRVVERRGGETGARHAAAGFDLPSDRDAAGEARVAERFVLVAGAKRAGVAHDHAAHLLRRQLALRASR